MTAELATKDLDLDQVYDSPEEQRRLAVIFENRFSAMLAAVHELVAATYPQLGADFVLDDAATRRMLHFAAERVVRIDDATRRAIQQTLEEGQRLGLSTWEIANGSARHGFSGIDGLFKETWKSRPDTVARTELQAAQAASARDRYLATGIVDRMQIIDGDYDQECNARNGRIVPVTQPVGLLHPNCTLVLVPLLRGQT